MKNQKKNRKRSRKRIRKTTGKISGGKSVKAIGRTRKSPLRRRNITDRTTAKRNKKGSRRKAKNSKKIQI